MDRRNLLSGSYLVVYTVPIGIPAPPLPFPTSYFNKPVTSPHQPRGPITTNLPHQLPFLYHPARPSLEHLHRQCSKKKPPLITEIPRFLKNITRIPRIRIFITRIPQFFSPHQTKTYSP